MQKERDSNSVFVAHSQEMENEGFEFRFKLPKDGLALRSVALVEGVPEIRFSASPKVPTITEEDFAIACRLASEGIRPEFFYQAIHFGHPFFGRQYKHYSPDWLRGTSVGELLAEADWTMKCLHIGARSNESKTAFWSWAKTSQLQGLATWPDFPRDSESCGGSIIMSCESVKVQKGDDFLLFVEEPKMKIEDQTNSLYSRYITEKYPSIAYYDEPLYLKMQEIPKLILAAEWLKEKGVKISPKWIVQHTTTPRVGAAVERKKPPSEIIPRPTNVMVLSSDVTVKTREAEQDRRLAKCGVMRFYGWQDHGSGERVMCTEDGKPFMQLQSLRMVVEKHVTVGDEEVVAAKLKFNFPIQAPNVPMTEFEGEITKQLPPSSNEEVSHPLGPMVLDVKVDNNITEKSIELTTTTTMQPCPPLALPQRKDTTVIRASVSDYDMLYGSYADPNEPVGIMEGGEPIIPQVKSWSELYSQTVPWPHTWQMPYIGVGEPAASGGVSTRSIPVTETPARAERRTEWVHHGQYKGCGDRLAVRAQRGIPEGTIRPATKEELEEVRKKFSGTWDQRKGRCPKVEYVFVVINAALKQRCSTYRQGLRNRGLEEHFHGTTLSCDIAYTEVLCSDGSCGICGISRTGLDRSYIKKNIDFQRFGDGFYLAPNSSKCHDYTRGTNDYRAMLLCDVCPGNKYRLERTDQRLKGPPRGYDSVNGQVGRDLNYEELVLYNPDAVMPRYIILYKKDGTTHPIIMN